MTTFLHTADWQLGRPFGTVPDAANRIRLQDERFAAVGRIGEVARANNASFILVAGDLFDSPSPDRRVVSRACAAIGALHLPVYVIPGNHDYGGALGPWEQPFFRQERDQLAPNLEILLEPKPVEAEGAILFPCPLLRRHESDDQTAWLRRPEALLAAIPAHLPRIILAHGSVVNFSADRDEEEGGSAVNQIDLTALDHTDWDYVALGDWHGCKQITSHAWYAGTPEPDRFPKAEDYVAGHVLVVTARRGSIPEVNAVSTGGFGWHAVVHRFYDREDLDRLRAWYEQIIGPRVGRDLLRMDLDGALGLEAQTALDALVETWATRLLRLDRRGHVSIAASEEDIAGLTNRTADPVTARIATILRERLADPEQRELAEACLRELHHAMHGEG